MPALSGINRQYGDSCITPPKARNINPGVEISDVSYTVLEVPVQIRFHAWTDGYWSKSVTRRLAILGFFVFKNKEYLLLYKKYIFFTTPLFFKGFNST